MEKVFRILDQISDRLTNLGSWISIICLLALSVLVSAAVLGRYFFNKPILGADEISAYLNVFIGFMALAFCLKNGRHVRIDIVTNRLSKSARRTLEIISTVLALIMVGQFIRTGWYSWMIMIQTDERDISYFRFPVAIPYGFMMLGWLILFLVFLVYLYKVIHQTGDEKEKVIKGEI